jgi:hypothetical protein
VSASRCAKCRGLLPPWLGAGAPESARCPNCGHANGTEDGVKSSPKSTNTYAPLEGKAPAGKEPSLLKTQMMGSAAPPAPATPNPTLAKTMMLGTAAPHPATARAEALRPQAKPPTPPKRIATLPQGTEPLPAPPSGLERTTILPASPAPARPAVPASPSGPPAAAGAMPAEASETDADISIELETPPPAPPSRKSLPAWVVTDALDDVGSSAIEAPTSWWQQRNARLAAAGAAVALVLLGTLMLRHRGPAEITGSPAQPSATTVAAPITPPPAARTAIAPASAIADKQASHPRPQAATAKPAHPPAVRPAAPPVRTAADPMVKPAPERPAVVASPRHLAVVSPQDRGAPAGAPAGDDQRRAGEAYARGNGQFFQGHVEEAIASFKESLKLDPRNPAAMRGLGLAYVQAGNTSQAVHFLKRYLKAAPSASDRALVEKRLEQLGAL